MEQRVNSHLVKINADLRLAYHNPIYELLLHRKTKGSNFRVAVKAPKTTSVTPQAPIHNRQTRKVANAKGLNRNTNLT